MSRRAFARCDCLCSLSNCPDTVRAYARACVGDGQRDGAARRRPPRRSCGYRPYVTSATRAIRYDFTLMFFFFFFAALIAKSTTKLEKARAAVEKRNVGFFICCRSSPVIQTVIVSIAVEKQIAMPSYETKVAQSGTARVATHRRFVLREKD
jgi:hypothetical protein